MTTVTISRKLAPKDDLIVIPKKEFDALIARAGDVVTEQDVLHWSRDAKKMYSTGRKWGQPPLFSTWRFRRQVSYDSLTAHCPTPSV